jgi:cell division protein ZapA
VAWKGRSVPKRGGLLDGRTPKVALENRKKSVRVNILGQDYLIKGDAEEAYIREVAAYLDQKMRTVAEGMPARSHAKVAVLAALNIADELFKEREESERKASEIEERLLSLSRNIEASLTLEEPA